jgi:hypothetical protein
LKSGYSFVATLGDPAIGDAQLYYSVSASPVEHPDVWLHYFIDATGIIRSKLGSAATRTDQAIQ